MANRRNYYYARQQQAHRSYLVSNDNDSHQISTQDQFELDESDVFWNSSNLSSSPNKFYHQQQVIKSSSKKHLPRSSDMGGTATSLPVNIPDWSKILKNDYHKQQNQRSNDQFYNVFEDEGEEEEDGMRIPPHEFLAKQMARNRITSSSFSVHEGVGRTLKGRDLSRVRNAIWAKTGFQD